MNPYYGFLTYITFDRSDMLDGFYAVPHGFVDFDPVSGACQFEKDDDGDEIVPEGFVFVGDEDEDTCYRMLALMLDQQDMSDAAVTSIGSNIFEHGKEEYLVVTDDEADEMWDRSLDNYIDECMDIPAHVEPYFDREKWKRDARIDGRGQALAGYDGDESCAATDAGEFYIYRQG